ncbi:MAG: DUF4388 domain-containing protein [Acidimicrobiia bacterium]
MSLIGTVDTIPLTDLFEVLAAARKTGALHVRAQLGLGIVYFDGGKLCAGEAGHRSGPVDDRPALVDRLLDVCFELFRFDEASFEFEVDGRPNWPTSDAVDVSEILAETARRLAEWAEILQTVPSLEARPRLIPDGPEDGVILDAAQWRVVAAIDGRRRINALIRVLDSSDFEVCGRLAGLVESGLVALDAPDPASVRAEIEDLVEPPVERRWAAPRPSRLAAVLEEDHWGTGEDGPDEVAMWDEQVMATMGGVFRQAVKEATPEPSPEAVADLDPEDELPEALPEPSPAEEPEVLTPS